MVKQVIYGRWEFPLGDTPKDEIFLQYRNNKKYYGSLLVGGISVTIRNDDTVILLTFDEDSELMLQLKYYGVKDVIHCLFLLPNR